MHSYRSGKSRERFMNKAHANIPLPLLHYICPLGMFFNFWPLDTNTGEFEFGTVRYHPQWKWCTAKFVAALPQNSCHPDVEELLQWDESLQIQIHGVQPSYMLHKLSTLVACLSRKSTCSEMLISLKEGKNNRLIINITLICRNLVTNYAKQIPLICYISAIKLHLYSP